MAHETYVPDTSVLINKVLSTKISKGELHISKIFIHLASLAELEHQANENRSIGLLGLNEVKELRKLSDEKGFELEFIGIRPRASEIKYADFGEIDALIRQAAFENGATLVTSDRVQAAVGEAQGIKTLFIEQVIERKKKIKLENYFDESTMSVHIRENTVVTAKKGFPGSWQFVAVTKKELTRDEIQELSKEIIEATKSRTDGFIEIERQGSTIIQMGEYRIVIIRPPFGDGWEITAVRAVKKLDLKDYEMSDKLKKRVEQAEGILIAGRPGEGKSTFARALAEYYASLGKIVKTVESPRDMLLSEGISQYSISKGTSEEVHDVLLLSRPDYTIFDEIRNTKDFALFTDLRLAGIGMAGVVHATGPIDAVQRFIGRVELGIIPHIVDTVVYIKGGKINTVFGLSMSVKVPAGMQEADLARPVVEVHDFETGKLKYEIYSYGEQTVVVPVEKENRKAVYGLAEEAIRKKMQKYVDSVEVEVSSDNRAAVYIPEKEIARIIGKEGKTIEKIEQEVGISIDVKELVKQSSGRHVPVEFQVEVKKNIMFFLDHQMADKEVEIYYGDDMLAMVKVGRKAVVKFRRDSPVGEKIVKAIDTGKIRMVRVG